MCCGDFDGPKFDCPLHLRLPHVPLSGWQGLRITIHLNYCPRPVPVKGRRLRFSRGDPFFREMKHVHFTIVRGLLLPPPPRPASPTPPTPPTTRPHRHGTVRRDRRC